jgi:hypothetical protein
VVFPSQPHTLGARPERQTFGKLSAHTRARKHHVPAAGPPPIFLKEIDHGPSHPTRPGAG